MVPFDVVFDPDWPIRVQNEITKVRTNERRNLKHKATGTTGAYNAQTHSYFASTTSLVLSCFQEKDGRKLSDTAAAYVKQKASANAAAKATAQPQVRRPCNCALSRCSAHRRTFSALAAAGNLTHVMQDLQLQSHLQHYAVRVHTRCTFGTQAY